MSDVKMLALSGSPRKNGNTETLLREFIKGACREGAVVEHIHIADYSITPCRECMTCFENGQCCIADDMEDIYTKLLSTDIIVLASPIFFYGVTAWAKALIDRVQALWARKYILHDPSLGEKGKKRAGFFISVGGTKGKTLFDGAIMTVKYFFDALNACYAGDLLFRQVDACGDILKQPDALAEATAAGERMVREFRAQPQH